MNDHLHESEEHDHQPHHRRKRQGRAWDIHSVVNFDEYVVKKITSLVECFAFHCFDLYGRYGQFYGVTDRSNRAVTFTGGPIFERSVTPLTRP